MPTSTTAAVLADCCACLRETSGDVPPPLVGSSTTIINGKAYVFGGRLVESRSMLNELYRLDLATFVWEKLWPPKDHEVGVQGPVPRYFHSAEAYKQYLVIAFGMAHSAKLPPPPDQPADEDQEEEISLRVLSDIVLYDTQTEQWSFPKVALRTETTSPSPRYAHLSCIAGDKLICFGGQDINNQYIEEINALDLSIMTWVLKKTHPGHAGTYRSVAVSRPATVHLAQPQEKRASNNQTWSRSISRNDPIYEDAVSESPAQTETSQQLSYSSYPPAPDEPIFTFTNYNFSDVKRSLEMITAPQAPYERLSVTKLDHCMVSNVGLPLGLRFPSACMIANYLVISGTHLSVGMNMYATYALDLTRAASKGPLPWIKIDAGNVLQNGSWNRAACWKNSLVVFGDKAGSITADYERRQTNYRDCAIVDLEAFGIYQPPPQILKQAAQLLGIRLLNQPGLSDFEIVCSDGKRVGCSRALLEQRWPWFAENIKKHSDAITGFLSKIHKSTTEVNGSPTESVTPQKPKSLLISEPSTIVIAALQYFYTFNLCTPLQTTIPSLVALLLFSRTYNLDHLRALTVHALHQNLSQTPVNAASIYEAACLSSTIGLQIRALRQMMQTADMSRPNSQGPQSAISTRSTRSVGSATSTRFGSGIEQSIRIGQK